MSAFLFVFYGDNGVVVVVVVIPPFCTLAAEKAIE